MWLCIQPVKYLSSRPVRTGPIRFGRFVAPLPAHLEVLTVATQAYLRDLRAGLKKKLSDFSQL
jgi:hypothetical protein